MARMRIGLLGGTFDPIHVGHLAIARAARDALRLDRVLFLPAGRPWQKPELATAATDRVQMCRVALAGEPQFEVDDREVRRAGPTYTIDTLIELRAELGAQPALVLVLGSDQLRRLHTWHRWRELLDHAHLAITQREQVGLETLPDPIEALVQAHGADALPDAPAGGIVFFRMPAVAVSSTVLREQLARGDRPPELVPAAVLDYIDSHALYR